MYVDVMDFGAGIRIQELETGAHAVAVKGKPAVCHSIVGNLCVRGVDPNADTFVDLIGVSVVIVDIVNVIADDAISLSENENARVGFFVTTVNLAVIDGIIVATKGNNGFPPRGFKVQPVEKTAFAGEIRNSENGGTFSNVIG